MDVAISVDAMIEICAPTFDLHHDGFGLQNDRPRISWRFLLAEESCSQSWNQVAYDIQIENEVYHVDSPSSVLVPWPAEPLQSRQQVKVRVRCYGCNRNEQSMGLASQTAWSPWAILEAGLLERQDWHASMITTQEVVRAHDGSIRPIRFRKVFSLPRQYNIRKARLYITSFGVYEAMLDGVRIGDHCMSPGWTSYRHRLHYQLFDIAEHLRNSCQHVFTVDVGAGWYASALGWQGGRRDRYGCQLAVLAQLEVEIDGEVFRICSDGSWEYSESSITTSEIYNGEAWDLRFDSEANSCWRNVALANFPSATLSTSQGPPVRVTQTLRPTEIFKSESGKTIVDFGQNIVGRIRVKHLRKTSGSRVSFRHAEVMEDGELGIRPLRTARSTDSVTFGDSDLHQWTPKFTFHGFRYVQIDGWSQDDEVPLSLESLVAEIMHTDLERTGHFQCSHPMLNQLHTNAVWSMRGNFLSIPTDCPQRDERLGWTGDIAVFAPSASFLFNVSGMLADWLKDLAVEQAEPGRKGIPPLVVPGVIEKEEPGDIWWPIVPQAIWGDATILVPWSLYKASGDENLLRQQFESMKSWLNQGVPRGPDDLWDEDVWQLGDWLDPTAPPDDPGNSRTDGTLVADAFLVHVTHLFEMIADSLEIPATEIDRGRHDRLRRAFQEKYVSKKGLLVGDSQTALALAIKFGLVEESGYQNAAARLARQVKKSRFKIATGFAGTPFICHALTESSQSQLAYRLILNKALPSWMYQIEQGSTTIWERWDSLLPDGTINPGEMTSFNHYALGSVIHWLHEYVGGISPLQPGWRQIMVQPIPGGTITSATVAFNSPYGFVKCAWTLLDGDFQMTLTVPPNSSAYVILPSDGVGDTTPNNVRHQPGKWVGSGKHVFECRYEHQRWPPRAILPPFWDEAQPEHV